MIVFLTSVVGAELDDGILFQYEHQQRRRKGKQRTSEVADRGLTVTPRGRPLNQLFRRDDGRNR
jgi:hypothetical protein